MAKMFGLCRQNMIRVRDWKGGMVKESRGDRMKKYWVDDDGYIIYGDGNNQVIVCEMYPEHVQALTKIIESGTPTEPQHGREPEKVQCDGCDKHCLYTPEPKPLAQYLDEYIEHEYNKGNIGENVGVLYAWDSWHELLQQALDAYESTEQVKIRIERV